MAHIKILSDYSPATNPNILHVLLDDQGDIHIWTYYDRANESKSIRLAASGSRHDGEKSVRVWKAFQELTEAYQDMLIDPDCHRDLVELNTP